MTVLTWISIAVLGPGALAVFVWFLRDVRSVVAAEEDESAPSSRS